MKRITRIGIRTPMAIIAPLGRSPDELDVDEIVEEVVEEVETNVEEKIAVAEEDSVFMENSLLVDLCSWRIVCLRRINFLWRIYLMAILESWHQ